MVGVCHKKLGLSGLCFFVSFFAFNDFASSSATSNSDGFYLGLSYSPAFSKIRELRLGVADYESKGFNSSYEVYPYSPHRYFSAKERVSFKADNFDWSMPNCLVEFNNSFFTAFEVLVGRKAGNSRLEFGVGYEKFVIKHGSGKGKTADYDGVFLFAKGISNSVVMDQPVRLANDIAKLSKNDMHLLSNSINIVDSSIDLKLCRKLTGEGNPKDGRCTKHASNNEALGKLSLAFGNQAAGNAELVDVHTSKTLAEDAIFLSQSEKGTLASLFTKLFEGAEVLEIYGIGSTSIMLNACHDFRSSKVGITPFACAGIGGDFVEVVDFSITPKPAYQLKAGLSFNINDSISAFSSAFFHHVLGDGQFSDLRLTHIHADYGDTDDSDASGIAAFGLTYYGAEFGLRLAF